MKKFVFATVSASAVLAIAGVFMPIGDDQVRVGGTPGIVFASAPSAASEPSTLPTPFLWYAFEDSSGTSVVNSGTDTLPGAWLGGADNAAQDVEAGVAGHAKVMTKTANVNFNEANTREFFSTLSQHSMTLSYWVYCSAWADADSYAGPFHIGAEAWQFMHILKAVGNPAFNFYFPGGGYIHPVPWSVTPFLPDNTWIHVTFVWDHIASAIRLYHNGVEVQYADDSVLEIPAFTDMVLTEETMMSIGNGLAYLSEGWSLAGVAVDDFRVYGTVLTDSQIASLYTSPGFSPYAAPYGGVARVQDFGAWFHVAADVTNSWAAYVRKKAIKGGVSYITRWDDWRTNGMYAQSSSLYPHLSAGTASNTPVVSFTPYNNQIIYGQPDHVNLMWSAASTGIRTIAAVWRTLPGFDYPPLIGNLVAYDFHGGAGGHVFLTDMPATGIRNGACAENGEVMAYDAMVADTFKIITIATSSSVSGDNFARDRNARAGGQELAEMLIFTNVITEANMTSIIRYLSGKYGIPVVPYTPPGQGGD